MQEQGKEYNFKFMEYFNELKYWIRKIEKSKRKIIEKKIEEIIKENKIDNKLNINVTR